MAMLLPKSFCVPKKLGLYPKSTSPPMMPAPMPPAFTPKAARPFEVLLPQFAPTHGGTYFRARLRREYDMP
jgi:hypothetical protein